ncbi:hypothetical protein ANCCAN_05347, partial [Ancylostoma caninum]
MKMIFKLIQKPSNYKKLNLLQDLLGRGNFCNVYKGIYNRPPDEKIVVAVKICHEGSASRGFQETKEARDQMLSEAQMMSYYVHSHVIE